MKGILVSHDGSRRETEWAGGTMVHVTTQHPGGTVTETEYVCKGDTENGLLVYFEKDTVDVTARHRIASEQIASTRRATITAGINSALCMNAKCKCPYHKTLERQSEEKK